MRRKRKSLTPGALLAPVPSEILDQFVALLIRYPVPAPAALGVRTTRHSHPTQETHKKWRTASAPDA